MYEGQRVRFNKTGWEHWQNITATITIISNTSIYLENSSKQTGSLSICNLPEYQALGKIRFLGSKSVSFFRKE